MAQLSVACCASTQARLQLQEGWPGAACRAVRQVPWCRWTTISGANGTRSGSGAVYL